jgi:hypothetical protein
MYRGGWLYPEAVSVNFAGEAGSEEDGDDCPAARTLTRQPTTAVASEQRKGLLRILIVFSPFAWTKFNG